MTHKQLLKEAKKATPEKPAWWNQTYLEVFNVLKSRGFTSCQASYWLTQRGCFPQTEVHPNKQ